MARNAASESETQESNHRGATVDRAADEIRRLLLTRELFPGQQLRQDELSEQIGISRGPTREALQALSKEGLVTHARNRGYAVARFDVSEMEQMYTLRDLIESEVLRSCEAPDDERLARLREINAEIGDPTTSVERAMNLNRDFHFEIFDLSPHKMLVREIGRWWTMTVAYRALGIGVWSERAVMMANAHEEQIQALLDQDLERLVQLSREHRWVSFQRIEALLR